MSDKLRKALKAARPKLREFAPFSFWFVLLMGIFNIALGLLLIAILGNTEPDRAFQIVTAIIPIKVWGIMFMVLGVAKLWALGENSWKWARRTLLIGVTLKSGWAVALALESIAYASNLFLTLFWITIAITQVLCYIHFLPPQVIKQKEK